VFYLKKSKVVLVIIVHSFEKDKTKRKRFKLKILVEKFVKDIVKLRVNLMHVTN